MQTSWRKPLICWANCSEINSPIFIFYFSHFSWIPPIQAEPDWCDYCTSFIYQVDYHYFHFSCELKWEKLNKSHPYNNPFLSFIYYLPIYSYALDTNQRMINNPIIPPTQIAIQINPCVALVESVEFLLVVVTAISVSDDPVGVHEM